MGFILSIDSLVIQSYFGTFRPDDKSIRFSALV